MACQNKTTKPMEAKTEVKIVVYQVFTRLFGNTNSTNKPWGTIEENGVGKFADFTDEALLGIKELGVTHIWYTGILHHALVNDYTNIGISNDDPDVIKGRAGSPYAVKDYYNVNPDLATNPAKRLEEFETLIARTHKHDMKVIIDIVPNHIARKYEGKTNPKDVVDFGANDDKTLEYHRDNNFYYIPNQMFKVPVNENYQPLGGEKHPLIDGKFDENPAKWTGNGSRLAQPDINDWYETVKINYGIKPDGSKDFDELPKDFAQKDYQAHYNFWKDKTVPNSWVKFKDICLYWIAKGVDGFRYDMAEMVPYEFWSYLNSNIKMKNPEAFLLAEIYNPAAYRDYINYGKMDYLYDKVELYDTLKNIIQGKGSTKHIAAIQKGKADIEHHMLHFLENHDEQRIASPEFAGNPRKALPAMILSATISTSPTMIYFGQEVGEPGAQNAGFSQPSRTSIFDYIGVPHHQRWMNNGKFDGGQLSKEETFLRDYYKRLFNFVKTSSALMGKYEEINTFNLENNDTYDKGLFSFVRYNDKEKLIIINNFNDKQLALVNLKIPKNIILTWQLKDGAYKMEEMLYNQNKATLKVSNGEGIVTLALDPLNSLILKL